MKNLITFAGTVAVALALSQTIQATPIVGNIGISGQVTFSDSTSPGTASGVATWINAKVDGSSGVFALPSPFALANGTPVTFSHSIWNFNTGVGLSPFWSVGGFTFNLQSSSIISQGIAGGIGFVTVSGIGTIQGNGFDQTSMIWTFSCDDPPADSTIPSWSFRASAASTASVPDGGATVMLLGIALAGVALLRKKLTI